MMMNIGELKPPIFSIRVFVLWDMAESNCRPFACQAFVGERHRFTDNTGDRVMLQAGPLRYILMYPTAISAV